MSKRLALVSILPALCLATPSASAQGVDGGEVAFRALYKELVETDTTLSQGSCTLAAQRMQARLLAGGIAHQNVDIVIPEKFPKQGNLIAEVPGRDASLPAVLLVAHIDVVEAKRSDWQRDPFKLVEEDGYFYARGAVDDKAMAATFVDTLIRFQQEGFRPDRTIKLALTCGEETDTVFNGVQYLLARQPEALRAGWAVNEGARGMLDAAGSPVSFGVQTGEKIYQDFRLVTTASGGHSARPTRDNAIDRLAQTLVNIAAWDFPIDLTPASRGFFARSAQLYDGQTRLDMTAIGNDTTDDAVFDRIAAANPLWNAYLRTTCISTLITGGHAENAQPQRAEANINCRIMPGQSVAAVRQKLVALAADAKVEVTLAAEPGPQSAAPPLARHVMGPIEEIANDMWSGIPIIPVLSSGATDGRFLNAAGIPTYGISGLFSDPDGNGVHGLNERIRVRVLMDGRTFLYRLVKIYAGKE